MESYTDESQQALSHKKINAKIMCVWNTIQAAAAESGIDENYYLLDNQPTCNSFKNSKYLSNIGDVPDGQYLRVHCNEGVTYTNYINALTGH